MSYLIDTNVISELVRPKPNINVLSWFSSIPEQALYLSVLTIGEIRKGIEKLTDTKRREKLRVWLENDLAERFDSRILDINQSVAERWGRLQNEMKRPIPAIDSLIAATALHYDLRLVTRNIEDFKYPPLEVICPWD